MPETWRNDAQHFITAAALGVKSRKKLKRMKRLLKRSAVVDAPPGLLKAIALIEEARRAHW